MPEQSVVKGDGAVQVANFCFDRMGFQSTPNHMERSFLAMAWQAGVPHPTLENGSTAENPWSLVTIRYHFEEALAFRFLALEAEILTGFITFVIQQIQQAATTSERSRRIYDVTPRHVLEAMTQWSLPRAGQRAKAVGSPGILSPEEATGFYNARVLRYEQLIKASVQNPSPPPPQKFQLGLPREHPWTAPVCCMADNICDALPVPDDQRVIVNLIMQSVISTRRVAFYETVLQMKGLN